MLSQMINEKGKGYPMYEEAPCIVACPIRQDARDYIQLIARRRFGEALQVVRKRNVLPGTCGRICTHPCETECRRSKLDKPLAIAALKRFLADLESEYLVNNKPEARYPERIAIIGAGPTGVAAAHDLSLMGYRCTIFEALGATGGMAGVGVPVFRLPRETLQRDIDIIKKMGVEIRFNTRLGADITIDGLKKDGYSAILIAVGLPLSRHLPIKGVELDGVVKGVSFLQGVNSTGKARIGEKVLVIGGGAVAMDCARAAMRLGPGEVHIACLESRKEMPTTDFEIEETLHEGAILHASVGPKRILGENGRVTGLETLKVQSVFDTQGRFNPTFFEGSEETLAADTIIMAIGQSSDLSFLNGNEGILTTRGGTIVVDKDTFMTNVTGVFSGGDVVLGRGTLTYGLAHGKKAALTIHNFLRKDNKKDERFDDLTPILPLAQRRVELIKMEERAVMPTLQDEKRMSSFEEVEMGFSEAAAVREAQRCMNCGAGAVVSPQLCVGCLTCVRVCPFEIPMINDQKVAFIDGDCQSCGICVVECPANAIEFKSQFEDQGETELKVSIKRSIDNGDSPTVVNLFCLYSGLVPGSDGFSKNIVNVGVLGLSKITPSLLLHAFAEGADGVLISVCKGEDCHYGNACMSWVERKVAFAKALLVAVGVSNERVKTFCASAGYGDEFFKAATVMMDGISRS